VLRRPDREDLAFALIWIVYAALAHRFWFVSDDAYISFRYARNWVAGQGLRYNLGEVVPEEGYSNFLWVAACAVIEGFGGDPTWWAPALSLACGSTLLYLVQRVLRREFQLDRSLSLLTTLSLGSFPPFALWSTGGLETMPFALAVFVTFYFLVLRRDGIAPLAGGFAGLVVALLRFEGVAWAVLIGGAALISRRWRGQSVRRPLCLYLGIVLSGFGIYFAARYAYHGLLLPNPVLAKVSLAPGLALRGLRYLTSFFLTFLTSLTALAGCVVLLGRDKRATGIGIVILTLAVPLQAVLVGGDWMVMGRLLVPGLAFNTLLLGGLVQAAVSRWPSRRRMTAAGLLLLIGIGLLPGWNLHLVPPAARARFHFRYSQPASSEFERWLIDSRTPEAWKEIGLALRTLSNPGESVVLGAIGAVGYYSGLEVFDRYGLVHREIALRPFQGPYGLPGHDKGVPITYFIDRHPTFVYFRVVTGPTSQEGEKSRYGLRDRILEHVNAWKDPAFWGEGGEALPRLYEPDLLPLAPDALTRAPRFLLVLRALEEPDDSGLASLSRRERRRARASYARERWNAFYERTQSLPN